MCILNKTYHCTTYQKVELHTSFALSSTLMVESIYDAFKLRTKYHEVYQQFNKAEYTAISCS